jgi:predicted NUDIX family NTP pyrophosphohydrolase
MKTSAGILLYRKNAGQVEVLIAHPGGPFWAKKDLGAWTIPKGLYEEGEDPLQAAKREFAEEVGQPVPDGEFVQLGTIEQKNNKTVIAWAVAGDLDVSKGQSNTFKMEWPPRSGKFQDIPEIDKKGWFSLGQAAKKLNPDQVPLIKRLANHLHVAFGSEEIPLEPQQGSLF